MNNETLLLCNSCGWFETSLGQVSLISKNKISKEDSRASGVVADQNSFATYNHKCKKCGYEKAEIVDLGIFYSDEDNLIFLKCGKCGYSERLGDKTM